MKYKGYTGVAELDAEAGTIFGHVIGLRDVITFQGQSVSETEQAFHDSVDDYLDFCKSRGESPDKSYSGEFVVRMDSRLHRELARMAEEQKISLNALVECTLAGVVLPGTASAKRAEEAAGPNRGAIPASASVYKRTAAKVGIPPIRSRRTPKR